MMMGLSKAKNIEAGRYLFYNDRGGGVVCTCFQVEGNTSKSFRIQTNFDTKLILIYHKIYQYL